jgi:hypothetical protein
MQFLGISNLGKPTKTGCGKIGRLISIPIRKRMRIQSIAIVLNKRNCWPVSSFCTDEKYDG